MAKYSGGVRSIAPVTSSDNWTITAGTGKSGKVIEVSFGGEVTTSTAMCTRFARSSGQTGATSAGNTAQIHPNSAAKGFGFGGQGAFATTQPSLGAGDLFAPSWNAHGGVVRWLANPGEEWVLIGAATELCISCRNSVGTGTSSYHTVWDED